VKNHIYGIPLIFALLTGCTAPVMRTITLDSIGDIPRPYLQSRPCNIEVDPVIDSRPVEETEKTNQIKFQYFIPAVIWWQWSLAGPSYADPKSYDSSLIPNLRGLIDNVLKKNNLCDPGASRQFVLIPELQHYYGVSYEKSMAFASTGGAFFKDFIFFPTGYVSLKLTLKDKQTGTIVGTRLLSETFLFNPADTALSLSETAIEQRNYRQNNKSRSATVALRKVMTRLPGILDEMLTEAGIGGMKLSSQTFTVWRLTREYDFIEKMVLETGNGRIVSDELVFRRWPIISKPDEWIVAPIDDNGHWLSIDEYASLITKLQDRYTIEFGSNLSAALFKGLRSGSQAPATIVEADSMKSTKPAPGMSGAQSDLIPKDSSLKSQPSVLPVESYGKLHITSDPPGGRIVLDGLDTKKTTPADLDSIKSGKHLINIYSGLLAGQDTVLVINDSSVQESLTLKNGTGTIHIAGTPQGSSVMMDGADRGKTPLIMSNIPSGNHVLSVVSSGFVSFTDTITLNAGEDKTITAALVKLGGFSISTIPSNARVSLDGKQIGETPLEKSGLSEGVHHLMLSLDTYCDTMCEVNIKPGETVPISLTLHHTTEYLKVRKQKKNRVEWTIRGITGFGALACLAGGYLANQEAQSRYDDYRKIAVIGDHSAEFQKVNNALTARNAMYSAAAVLGLGFTITFIF
jgi:hypothetical protein